MKLIKPIVTTRYNVLLRPCHRTSVWPVGLACSSPVLIVQRGVVCVCVCVCVCVGVCVGVGVGVCVSVCVPGERLADASAVRVRQDCVMS